MSGLPLSFLTNQAVVNQDTANISQINDADTKALLDMLQGLSNGETLIAHVLSSDNSSFTVKTDNNILINAKAEGNVSLKEGSTVLFEVNKYPNNSFSLRPLNINTNEVNTAKSAILEAGLPFNNSSFELTKRLMEYSLPIDKSSLQKSFSDVSLNPQVPIKYIADLIKLDIPCTKENLQSYEAYLNMENSVLDGLSGMSKESSQYFTKMILDSSVINAPDDIIKNTIDSVKTVFPFLEEMPDEINSLKEKLVLCFKNGENEAAPIKENDVLVETKPESDLLPKAQLTDKNLLSSFADSKEIKKVFDAFFKNTFDKMFTLNEDEMALKPEIKNLYERLFVQTKRITEGLSKGELKDSPIVSQAINLSNNVDFINSLNQYIPYVQIPFRNNNGTHTGELYVFKNSKGLTSRDEELSAFVHLDTDNLGATDVYIRLRGEHVTTDFCLENEEYLNFIEKNISFLNKRLNDKGYSLSVETKVLENKKSPIEVMLENTTTKIPPVMTSFDARV